LRPHILKERYIIPFLYTFFKGMRTGRDTLSNPLESI
jgi:hypothetical protein